MTALPEPPALTHIEKTLSDAYRKEIDQEENVWRSLPFFAATLALQLAALFQLVDRLPPATAWTGVLSLGFLLLSALATLTALGFLAACIYPRKFQYLAPDPELLEYAKGLILDEAAQREQPDVTPISAVVTLKEALALQYAVGAQHNRRINKMRERLRSIAGLATIVSVVLTLCLVGSTFLHYLPRGLAETTTDAQALTREATDRDAEPSFGAKPAAQPPRPADAGRDEGVVGAAGGAGQR